MKVDLLDIYSDYLISQSHHATATGLAALFDGELSHDQVSRYLRSGEFGSKELWNYVKSDVRSHEQKSGGVLLKDIAFPAKLLKKIVTNEDGSTGTLYLITNDLSIDADRMYQVYQKRGRIEVFHKSIKQNASLSKSPTKTIQTQCNHLFASMIAFCKLELLKVKTDMNHFAIKQKLLLKANQIMFNELQLMKAAA